jgi:hypothetical protein
MTTLNLDLRAVTPDEGRGLDPVPAAWYNWMVTESKVEPTKDTQGVRLNIVCTIIDGQYKGRKAYHGFNLKNANPKAVEIAMGQLSALGHAIGVLYIQDDAQLHNKPFKGKVKVVPKDGEYEAKNEFTAFKNVNDTSVGNDPVPAAAPAGAPTAWTPPAAAAPAAAPAQAWTPPAAAAQPWAAPADAAPAAAVAPAAAPVWTPPAEQPAPVAAAPAPAAEPAPAPAAEPAAGGAAVPPWMQPAQ